MTAENASHEASTELEGEKAISWAEMSETLAMLAQVVSVVPDETWVPSLVQVASGLDESAPGCARMKAYLEQHKQDSLDELVRNLAVDWTLAFRGVNPAHGPRPPYAGAWIASDGTGIDVMLAINSCYVQEGLGSSGNRLNRYDYLGVELEFIAYLAKGLEDQEDEGRRTRAAKFIDAYVLSWLPRFREQVEECCDTEFWKGFLELICAVLSDVREALA